MRGESKLNIKHRVSVKTLFLFFILTPREGKQSSFPQTSVGEKKKTDVIMKILGHTSVSTSLYQRSRWLEKIKYFKKLLTFKVVLTTAQKTFVLCLCHIPVISKQLLQQPPAPIFMLLFLVFFVFLFCTCLLPTIGYPTRTTQKLQ